MDERQQTSLESGRTGLSENESRGAGIDAAASTARARERGHAHDRLPAFDPAAAGVARRGGPAGAVTRQLEVAVTVTARPAGMKLKEMKFLDVASSPALAPLYALLQISAHNALATRSSNVKITGREFDLRQIYRLDNIMPVP